MSDTLLEQIKAVLEADTDPLPNTKALMFDQMLLRILRDAETIKAAEALAECVMTAIDYAQDVANGYLWSETKKGEMDALVRLPKSSGLDDLLRFKEALAAFRAAQEKNDG